MKTVYCTVPALALAMLVSVGCKSSQEPGVKTNYRTQWTTVAADTETTAEAAKNVFMGDNLKEVSSKSTKLDGQAWGQKADGTKVVANIEKLSDTTSQVSVTVGTMGDPALGTDYATRIKAAAEK